MSHLRRELLQDLIISDSLCTFDKHTSHGSVSVPQIDEKFRQVPSQQVKMAEWLRILTREGLMQSGSVEAAEVAIASVKVKGAKARRAAARCLVLVFRAFTADRERPHVSDATSFWRQVSEKQLTDLLERLVRLLLPNGLHQAGLESAMHAQFLRVRTDVRPLQVGYVNPLGQGMASRGNKTEGFFMEFVYSVSDRCTLYHTPADIPGASVGSTQRLASLGFDSMA